MFVTCARNVQGYDSTGAVASLNDLVRARCASVAVADSMLCSMSVGVESDNSSVDVDSGFVAFRRERKRLVGNSRCRGPMLLWAHNP